MVIGMWTNREGTAEPFIARLMVGILELRDDFILSRRTTSPDSLAISPNLSPRRSSTWKALLLMRTRIVLSIALFLISTISLAQTTFNPAEIAKKVMPSVVLIKGTSGEGE